MRAAKVEPKKDFDIQSLIEKEVAIQLRAIRSMLYGFICGVLVLGTIGFSFKDVFLIPLMKFMYPPQIIYSEIKNEDFDKHVAEIAWKSFLSGDQSLFSQLTEKKEFYSSIEDKFNTQMVSAFGMSGSSYSGVLNQNEQLRSAILKKSGDWQRAIIKIAARQHNAATTACGRTFYHSKRVAILRIPTKAPADDYAWLKCDGVLSGEYILSVSADGTTLEGIQLVGIERGDTENNELELKLAIETGRQLNLSKWKSYESRIVGSYKFTDIRWK